MKTRTLQTLRTITQIITFAAFMLLVIAGRSQLWLAVFAVFGIVLSLFAGRVYCGWICPMGTALRAETWIFKKLHIKRKTPKAASLKRYWFRILFLIGFLALLVPMMRSGEKQPVLLYLTGASVLVSLFFHEAVWHRAVCPFGTILSITSRISPRKMQVAKAQCIGCSKCEPVCPSMAISKEDQGKKREIIAHECFLCNNCREACPVAVIDWKNSKA
jgi:ferredoxin-type protein NapH